MEQQTFTMMSEDDTPEVGPNDIVIHLVNPYKCGMCELEFLEKNVFKDHIFSHLEQIKQEKPSSQIVMNIVLPPETPGGVTVTRDILQLGEDGSIKQVLQPTNNITLDQVHPLKELEAAGVIKLDPPLPVKPTPVVPTISTLAAQSATTQTVNLTNPLAGKELQPQTSAGKGTLESISTFVHSQNSAAVEAFIKEEDGENDVSEIIENNDGTFSVAFKGPNNEMQHIQIIRPEWMKGEMMLELTNVHNRRRSSKGISKSNECDICGKILSSSTNLLRHKMYHSSERPFVCSTCGKGFKDVSNLKKHKMIHNRIFSCHLCKKSFLRKSLLAMHLKRHQARTVFVKCGHGAKEVTLRTYMDDDGTRVEEMSMAALSGQTFEYKKRIVKADPGDLKPSIANGDETEDFVSSNVSTEEDAAATEGLASEVDPEQKSNGESFVGPELQAKDEVVPTISSDAVDDLPEFKVPEGPKEFVKMYQCGHCGKRTVQRGNMMRHLIHHLNDKPFKCDECPKQFVDKGELVKHKKTHSKPYRCNQCNGAFAHNVQLIKHQESECLGKTGDLHYTSLEDGQTYRCDICQIEMKRLGNMIKHVGTHSSGKHRSVLRHSMRRPSSTGAEVNSPSVGSYSFSKAEQTFQCNYCQKIFKEKTNLLSHMRTHTGEWSHACSDCNRTFPSKAELEKHSFVHLKPFKCNRCPAVFSRKIFLETHMRRHKEKERGDETNDYGVSGDQSQYYCKHCDKMLSQKFRMMNHIRSHLDNRPYECTECNKCFSYQYMLSNHRKIHSKLFTCENCGGAFTRKFFLQIHRKKYHSLKDDDVDDEEISLSSSNNGKPMKHEFGSLDSNDKSFTCFICGCSFARLVIKLNHEKKCKEETKILHRVANGNGFQCKICSRVTTLKHNLMVHIRKAHSDVINFDPSGFIHVKSRNTKKDLPESDLDVANARKEYLGSSDEQTPLKKKRRVTSLKKKGFEDFSDDEMEELAANMEEGEDESDADDRYTRTPGGYACAACRTKFLDRDALFSHLEFHCEESGKDKGFQNQTTGSSVKDQEDSQDREAPLDENEESSDLKKENDTPRREQGRPAKSASAKSKTSGPKSMSKTPSMSSTTTRESFPQTPTSLSRSSNRPPRAQKIPSRFLE